MADLRKHSSTSNLIKFVLKHATTGVGLTGISSASSGLIISTIADNEAAATTYTVAGSTIETIAALGTFAAPTATKCRFKEVDAANHPGLYEFQFADARFSVASAKRLVISVSGVTDLLDSDYEIQLDADVNVSAWSATLGANDNHPATQSQVDGISSGSSGAFPFAPDADNILKLTIDNAGAVDKGAGLVGIPVTGHGFEAGREVVIADTINYNGTEVIVSQTANEVVITASFVSETFGGTETIKSSFFGVVSIGTETGTFANLELNPATFHEITDTGNAFDIIYRIPCGKTKTSISIDIQLYLNSNNDVANIQVYDHIGTSWDTLDTIVGTNGSGLTEKTLRVFQKHTGAFGGANAGEIYIRIVCTAQSSPNLFTATLSADAISADAVASYELGQLWLNTALSNTNTTPGIDGRANNPVSTIAAIDTLIASTLIQDVHIINGSTVTLESNSDNQSFFGDNWILALAGESVAGAYFQGPHVSGVGLSTSEVHFEGCEVHTMSVQIGHFDFCSFSETVTHTLAGDYNYHNCYSKVAGVGAPTFTKTAGQAITSQWRNWAGSITVGGIEAGDVMTISGTELGAIVLNGAEGTVKILGEYESLTDNRTGTPTLVLGAFKGSDIASVLDDTGTSGVIVATNNDKTGYSLSATGLDLILSTATSFVAIAKAVWDRIISKANHNVGQSAGKITRQSGDLIQIDGAVSDASPTTTDFDTTLTQMDTYFADAIMVFVNGAANAGIGKAVSTYVNASGHVTFVADMAWPETPVNGDDFVIVALHEHPISELQNGLATEAKQDLILADTGSGGIPKNAAFSDFQFPMVLTSDHYTAAIGLTVTGEMRIDNAAFVAVNGTITEVSDGLYEIDLTADDTNGDIITYKFSSATADDTMVTIITRS